MLFDTHTLESFPTQSGVYIMKGQSGAVLYVGKGKNLKQRVKQYFAPGGDGRFMVPFLIAKVAAIETIVVSSEKEALLLENNLIKEHKPKYNALLKDDKTYIALKMTTKHRWPMLQLVRYRGKPKPDGTYFGPYTSAYAARQTLDLLARLFPLRQCSDQEFARRTRPCILYDMKRCCAPCVGKCTAEEYALYVTSTTKFLKGQDTEVLKELHHEMQQAADNLEFERAAAILKSIRQIETTVEAQNVDKPLGEDSDVIALFRQGDELILSQLFFRGGRLMGVRHYNFSMIAEDDKELIVTFLLQHYEKVPELPHEVLVSVPLEESEAIAEILSTGRKRRLQVHCPQRGDKRAMVEMAALNAESAFKKEKDAKAIRERTLLEMQERFHLTRYPRRIECFDNSNIAGTEPVSSLVAFTEGEKDPARYRKYKIKTAAGMDDYGALREALTRRYKRAKEENNLPDLLIVDGGKGHLNVALKVMASLDIVSVDLIGVAKEEGRHDKGMTEEQVYLPGIKDPVYLKRTSSVLFFLQQIRDEAHRVAISFHRKRRSKLLVKSELDEISGIGPTKRALLLRHFGSLKKIKEATKEELIQVKGISESNALEIINYFL